MGHAYATYYTRGPLFGSMGAIETDECRVAVIAGTVERHSRGNVGHLCVGGAAVGFQLSCMGLTLVWAGGHWASLPFKEMVSEMMCDFCLRFNRRLGRDGWPGNRPDSHECEAQANLMFLFGRAVLYAKNAQVIRNDRTSRSIGAGETSGL